MNRTDEQKIGEEVDNLIDKYAREHEGREFIEALDIIIDRAQTAKDAREEELGEEDEDDDEE